MRWSGDSTPSSEPHGSITKRSWSQLNTVDQVSFSEDTVATWITVRVYTQCEYQIKKLQKRRKKRSCHWLFLYEKHVLATNFWNLHCSQTINQELRTVDHIFSGRGLMYPYVSFLKFVCQTSKDGCWCWCDSVSVNVRKELNRFAFFVPLQFSYNVSVK